MKSIGSLFKNGYKSESNGKYRHSFVADLSDDRRLISGSHYIRVRLLNEEEAEYTFEDGYKVSSNSVELLSEGYSESGLYGKLIPFSMYGLGCREGVIKLVRFYKKKCFVTVEMNLV